MKIVLIFCSVLLTTSLVCAETYKWEDANGMHFTDNPTSIPEKYRAKALGAVREDIQAANPQVGKLPAQQNITIIEPDHQIKIEQTDIERNRILAESIRSQQAAQRKQSAIHSARMQREVLQPLARFVAFWILIGSFTFIVWLFTLVDILRNEFTNPSNKMVWLILVLCLAPLGVLLYLMFGRNQKINGLSASHRERAELLSRLHPKEQKDGDFKIN